MDLSKFSSKAQGLLGKISEVKQELSEKASEATQRAAETISTKSSGISNSHISSIIAAQLAEIF